jgi:hypothetical protein
MLDDARDTDGAIGGLDLEADHIFEVAKQRFRGRDVPKFQVEQLSKFIAGLRIELEYIFYAAPFLFLIS